MAEIRSEKLSNGNGFHHDWVLGNQERNAIKLEGRRKNPSLVIFEIIRWICELNGLIRPSKFSDSRWDNGMRLLVGGLSSIKYNPPFPVLRIKPPSRWIALNVDGSSKDNLVGFRWRHS